MSRLILFAVLSFIWIGCGSPDEKFPANQAGQVNNETDHVRKVKLNDNSIVWLNAYASLSWKEDFDSGARKVELTGEAFFDISKDDKRPFVVHTRDMTIRALGTAFNVEAYNNELMSRISLVNGNAEVVVNKDSSVRTLLQPGYAATFSKLTNSFRTGQTDPGIAGARKEGSFVIENVSIYDAVRRLCERNGYAVHWSNTDNSQKIISAVFKKENFKEIISNLCNMVHKEYKITGKQVTIY